MSSSRTRRLTVGLLVCSVVAFWSLESDHSPLATKFPVHIATPSLKIAHPGPDVWLPAASASRKFYPYSVIPGGIASIAELKKAIGGDPFLARHLENFNLQKAKLVEVASDRPVYVSYRRGGQIFWTSRRLTLAKGEMIVTDGNRTLRTRCGNDVSDVPAEPTSRAEPTPTELDTPLPALETQPSETPDPILDPSDRADPIDDDLSPVPFLNGPPSTNFVPPISSPPYFPVNASESGQPSPPVSVPEPSTMMLAFLGFAGIGAKRLFRKRT